MASQLPPSDLAAPDRLLDFVTTLDPFVPLLVLGLLLLALLIAIWLWRSLSHAASAQATSAGDRELPSSRRHAHTRGVLKRSFAQTVSRLRAHIPGEEPLYRVPWLMVLGAGGGDTAGLLGNSGLSLSLHQHRPDVAEPCSWWFFEQGVVLEPAGEVIDSETDHWFYGDAWQQILRLLLQHRPRRPLDGVIVVIPATDLIGVGSEQLKDKAGCLYRRLWEMQKSLSMRLPIYVVVSGLEGVPGFSALAQELPARLRNSIFGWSNPHPLDSVYSAGWNADAFAAVGADLLSLQADILTERSELGDADGIALFPSRLAELQAPTQVFLDQIFSPSAYHEAYFFRGLYFTGADEQSVLESDGPAMEAPPTAVLAQVFLADLFTSKIFPEHGLGYPLGQPMSHGDRRVRCAQAAALLLLLGGSIGMWQGFKKAEGAAQGLPARIYQIHESRSRLMDLVGQDALRDTSSRGLDPTRSLHSSRALRCGGKMLSDPAPTATPLGKEIETLLAVLADSQTSDFQSVFIPASWFSGLRDEVRTELLRSYTEQVLPGICLLLTERLANLSRWRAWTPSQTGAATNLWQDIRHYLAYVEQLEKNMALYNRLVDWYRQLAETGRAVEGTQPTAEEFIRLTAYVFSISEADAQRQFGRNARRLEGVEEAMAQRLRILRGRIVVGLDRVAIEALRGHALAYLPSPLGPLSGLPAGQVGEVWQALQQMRRQGLLSWEPIEGDRFVAQVPAGKHLRWDLQHLKEAIDWAEEFELFRFQAYPEALRRNLEPVARDWFAERIRARLGQAQRFSDPGSATSGMALESEVSAASENFALASGLLAELTEKMKRLRLSRLEATLRNLSTTTAVQHLGVVERFTAGLYRPDYDFAWWEGELGLANRAFKTVDAEALGAYLFIQRERIDLLANRYARPYVMALTRSSQAGDSLVMRWQRILLDLDNYQAKRPDNSVARLEHYILTQMNALDADNCLAQSVASTAADSNDFFSSRRQGLESRVNDRCVALVGARLGQAYARLAGLFNRQVAGRFPFVTAEALKAGLSLDSAQAAAGVDDATPASLRAVYRLVDSLPQGLAAALSGEQPVVGVSDAALGFMRRLEAVRPFLQPWLADSPDGPTPELNFAVEFRVLRDQEVGSNQIIEWLMSVDAQAINRRSVEKRGVWRYGDPVTMRLTWADGSAFRPHTDLRRSDLTAVPPTSPSALFAGLASSPASNWQAVFEYRGGWSLLRMILANRPAYISGADGLNILELAVPVVTKRVEQPTRSEGPDWTVTPAPQHEFQTRVYIEVTLLAPRVGEEGVLAPVAIPRFPSYAPAK